MISMLLAWTALLYTSGSLAIILPGNGRRGRQIHVELNDYWEPRMVELPEILQRFYKTPRPLNKYRCMPLKSDVCKRFGYNESYFPNPLNHNTEEEAVAALRGFTLAVESSCSSDLMFLLCSLHMPPCSSGLPHPIYPCRSVCKRARRSCKRLLKRHGLSWPSMLDLRCNDLPKKTNMSSSAVRPVVCLKTPPDLRYGEPFFPTEKHITAKPTKIPTIPSSDVVCSHTPKTCKRQLPLRKSTFCKHRFDWILGGVILEDDTDFNDTDFGGRRCFSVEVFTTTYFTNMSLHAHRNETIVICTSTPLRCPRCLQPVVGRRMIMAGTQTGEGKHRFAHYMNAPTVIFKENKVRDRWFDQLKQAERWARNRELGILRCST